MTIKTFKKPKKGKKLSYYQNKCDRLLQELGRETYNKCLICGGEYSTLHHFVLKSQSTALRYDWENCIPVCHKCHCSVHIGRDDTVVARIVLIKGQDWFDELMEKKRIGLGVYRGITWYKQQLEILKAII